MLCIISTSLNIPHSPAEKDTSNELLWVWSFPSVDPSLRQLIKSKSTISKADKEGEEEGEEGLDFSFGHFQQTWYYLSNFSMTERKTLPKVSFVYRTYIAINAVLVLFLQVTTFCVVVLAKVNVVLLVVMSLHTWSHSLRLPVRISTLRSTGTSVGYLERPTSLRGVQWLL